MRASTRWCRSRTRTCRPSRNTERPSVVRTGCSWPWSSATAKCSTPLSLPSCAMRPMRSSSCPASTGRRCAPCSRRMRATSRSSNRASRAATSCPPITRARQRTWPACAPMCCARTKSGVWSRTICMAPSSWANCSKPIRTPVGDSIISRSRNGSKPSARNTPMRRSTCTSSALRKRSATSAQARAACSAFSRSRSRSPRCCCSAIRARGA